MPDLPGGTRANREAPPDRFRAYPHGAGRRAAVRRSQRICTVGNLESSQSSQSSRSTACKIYLCRSAAGSAASFGCVAGLGRAGRLGRPSRRAIIEIVRQWGRTVSTGIAEARLRVEVVWVLVKHPDGE